MTDTPETRFSLTLTGDVGDPAAAAMLRRIAPLADPNLDKIREAMMAAPPAYKAEPVDTAQSAPKRAPPPPGPSRDEVLRRHRADDLHEAIQAALPTIPDDATARLYSDLCHRIEAHRDGKDGPKEQAAVAEAPGSLVGDYAIDPVKLDAALKEFDTAGKTYQVHPDSPTGIQRRQGLARGVVANALREIDQDVMLRYGEGGPLLALVRLLTFASTESLI